MSLAKRRGWMCGSLMLVLVAGGCGICPKAPQPRDVRPGEIEAIRQQLSQAVYVELSTERTPRRVYHRISDPKQIKQFVSHLTARRAIDAPHDKMWAEVNDENKHWHRIVPLLRARFSFRGSRPGIFVKICNVCRCWEYRGRVVYDADDKLMDFAAEWAERIVQQSGQIPVDLPDRGPYDTTPVSRPKGMGAVVLRGKPKANRD